MTKLELPPFQYCRKDAPTDLANLGLILVDEAEDLEGQIDQEPLRSVQFLLILILIE